MLYIPGMVREGQKATARDVELMNHKLKMNLLVAAAPDSANHTIFALAKDESAGEGRDK